MIRQLISFGDLGAGFVSNVACNNRDVNRKLCWNVISRCIDLKELKGALQLNYGDEEI